MRSLLQLLLKLGYLTLINLEGKGDDGWHRHRLHARKLCLREQFLR